VHACVEDVKMLIEYSHDVVMDLVVILVSVLTMLLNKIDMAETIPINPSILSVCQVLRLAQGMNTLDGKGTRGFNNNMSVSRVAAVRGGLAIGDTPGRPTGLGPAHLRHQPALPLACAAPAKFDALHVKLL